MACAVGDITGPAPQIRPRVLTSRTSRNTVKYASPQNSVCFSVEMHDLGHMSRPEPRLPTEAYCAIEGVVMNPCLRCAVLPNLFHQGEKSLDSSVARQLRLI